MNKLLASIVVLPLIFSFGCTPDDGGGTTLTGQLVDSPVQGVYYETSPSARSGFTDANGNYSYEQGDTVTFSIGGITFPTVAATGVVTPLDMAGTTDINDPTVINIARLLQTLDYNSDPDDGITITEPT